MFELKNQRTDRLSGRSELYLSWIAMTTRQVTHGRNLKKVANTHTLGSSILTTCPGTYTYPISYAIPANSSPTLQCNYGSVTWRLRATAHRPGAFTSKFVATREVLVINGPTEDDTENHEHIVVERQWDQQLQYLISVSGRSFYIGGPLPIMFTFMPLAKIKLHQIHVFIEGVVDCSTPSSITC